MTNSCKLVPIFNFGINALMARQVFLAGACLTMATAFCGLHFLSAKAATADWAVTINTSVVDKCLEYPDSKFKPLIRSAIHFQQDLLEQTKEDKEVIKLGAEPDIAIPDTLYENQYSSHFRAVGMHRFKRLMLKPGSPGRIRIATSNSSFKQEEVNAAANATLRLCLDLYLNKMFLRNVSVPRELYELYVQELQRYGFRPITVVPGQTVSALMTLSVRSEPAGKSVYLGYGM